MNYPLISEYIESIKAAEDNFDELSYLLPVLNDSGQPVMTSGNFAVVFKMEDQQTGKLYAVKCFTREQERREDAYRLIDKELKRVESSYMTSVRYLDKELFVDTDQTNETEFPVLLMDWVEGKTLDKYLRENLDDKYALEMLAYRFSKLAQWLIPQPFAHGDLKPDNILVREDGSLVLVDYDGMYVPAMKGQKARELGSPDFRHPLRTEDDFDEHIDEFPIVSILLSLKATTSISQLFTDSDTSTRLFLSYDDYLNVGGCTLLKKIFPSEDMVINQLVSLFILALSEKNLPTEFVELFLFKSVDQISNYSVLTSVSQQDRNDMWVDELGASYSQNKIKLLYGAVRNVDSFFPWNYIIPEGTRVIADRAFSKSTGLEQILLSDSITHIGDYAFERSEKLTSVRIPSSVKYIGKNPFRGCNKLEKVICSSESFIVQNSALYTKDMKNLVFSFFKDKFFVVPDTVECIGDSAFEDCKSIRELFIPASVKCIKESAFENCSSLRIVKIVSHHTIIGHKSFDGCSKRIMFIVPKDSVDFYSNSINIDSLFWEEMIEIGGDKEILLSNHKTDHLIHRSLIW